MPDRRSFLTTVASGSVGLSLVTLDPAATDKLASFGAVAFAATMRVRFDAGLTDDDLQTIAKAIDANLDAAKLLNPKKKRLKKYGPAYNAVVTILHERGLREARRADRERAQGRLRGPLHGIPYGVKDLLATPDAPTTWGAAPAPAHCVLKNATKGCMPAVRRNFNASLDVLATFCDLKYSVALPDLPYGGYVAYTTPAVDYIDAQRQRTIMNRALHEAFGDYDAVVSPTLPTITYPIGQPFDKTYTQYSGTPELISPGNLAGLPALAMPNGFGDHGLPTGVALMGTAFNEMRLAAVAKRYQQLTTFHQRRPPLVTKPRA